MFDSSPVFYANYQDTHKIKVNQGGTWSTKTYSILQVLCQLALDYPGNITTVAGQDMPNLKKGPIRDINRIIKSSPYLESIIKSFNKTDQVIEFKNGTLVEFNSYQDEQDAHSGKRDFLFINEANGVSYEIFRQLFLRTDKYVFLDYNPSAEFWVHEQVLANKQLYPSTELFISDHRHNPFISQEMHDQIERLKYDDEELYKVYARGKTGKIEGVVLRNCFVIEDDKYPLDATLIGGGMDFGFTNDVTGFIEVRMQNGELYVRELMYDVGLTNPDISNILQSEINWNKRNVIVADSAEPKSIEELRRLGWNIEPAQKGPDSIKNGLDILKRYTINYTRSSVNFKKEVGKYVYKKDRQTGKSTNEPIDSFNHLIDPLRYVALNKLAVAAAPNKITSRSLGQRNRDRRFN